MSKTVLKNTGAIVSGDLREPLLPGDTIVVEDGRFAAIGYAGRLDLTNADTVLDIQQMTVAPGLIDPHVHVVVGDWTPRQTAFGWMEGALQAGVTTAISQGAAHVQGMPPLGKATKALSLTLAYTYQNFRPGGMKVHGGSVILESGLDEADFREMHEAGVRTIAEIGGAGITDPEEVLAMVRIARNLGWTVPVHLGAKSIPGSVSLITAESVLRYEPDLLVHVNGGSTAAPWPEIEKTITQSQVMLEVIYSGNTAVGHRVIRLLRERGELHRLLLGSDTPTCFGVVPNAILRTVVDISSVHGIPAAQAWAFATGNVAKVYKLDVGLIRPGAPADLVVVHPADDACTDNGLACIEYGDTPSINLIMVDGRVVAEHARNTRISSLKVLVEKYTPPAGGGRAEDVLYPGIFRGGR
ncbi:MAG: amidohydrolase family protein [Chloroflexi bacterium]|nr:amidohydrolase family protein [Chloroflexota bacterium]